MEDFVWPRGDRGFFYTPTVCRTIYTAYPYTVFPQPHSAQNHLWKREGNPISARLHWTENPQQNYSKDRLQRSAPLGVRDWRVELVFVEEKAPLTFFCLSLSPLGFFFSLLPEVVRWSHLQLFHLSRLDKQTMFGADKKVMAREAGMDAPAQDDLDMERLGKVQQFKVCVADLSECTD